METSKDFRMRKEISSSFHLLPHRLKNHSTSLTFRNSPLATGNGHRPCISGAEEKVPTNTRGICQARQTRRREVLLNIVSTHKIFKAEPSHIHILRYLEFFATVRLQCITGWSYWKVSWAISRNSSCARSS